MCWDEYKQYKAALSDKRERTSSELRYVLANRVRMDQGQRASAELLRSRLVAALPPLPPEPYEIRTTFPSNHRTLRERLLLPYYAILCSTILLLLPLSVLITVIHQCLVKVGLWPYIEKAFRNLVLSPILSAAGTFYRSLQYSYSAGEELSDRFWPYIERPIRYLGLSPILFAARSALRPLRYSYAAAVGLSRDCTGIARGNLRRIIRSVSLTVALLLLPSRALLGLVHRTTKLASVAVSPTSCPVECKKPSCSCSLTHLRDAMAGFGKKFFYSIITAILGFFCVLPLIAFAVVTTSLAIGWLSFMMLLKWAGVIRRSILHWWNGDDRNTPEAIAERNRAAADAKREARSRSESCSQASASSATPRSQSNRSNRSGSNISLVSLPLNPPQIDRDYEGTLSNPILCINR